MSETENLSIKFWATCRVLDKSENPRAYPIKVGLRANLFINQVYCISEVQKCANPIFPEEIGELFIYAIILKEELSLFSKGEAFELREAPKTIAHCEIISEVEILGE